MVAKRYNAVSVTDKLQKGKKLYIKDDRLLSLTEDELDFDTSLDAQGLYVTPDL